MSRQGGGSSGTFILGSNSQGTAESLQVKILYSPNVLNKTIQRSLSRIPTFILGSSSEGTAESIEVKFFIIQIFHMKILYENDLQMTFEKLRSHPWV